MHFASRVFHADLIERIISQLKKFLWITKVSLIVDNQML